jgi:hypothetical protein
MTGQACACPVPLMRRPAQWPAHLKPATYVAGFRCGRRMTDPFLSLPWTGEGTPSTSQLSPQTWDRYFQLMK